METLRTPRRKRVSKWEALLARQLALTTLPPPKREYRFHPVRKWKFDFVWLPEALAAEVEGAVFGRGRHTRGTGFAEDAEKYNEAVLLGWRVLRFTEKQILSGRAVATIRAALEQRAHPLQR